MAQDIMLHVKNITAGYGKLQILNGMTLQVRRDSRRQRLRQKHNAQGYYRNAQSDKRRNHL